MSDGQPTWSPNACSGLRYGAVPMTSRVRVTGSVPKSRAMPKSVSFARPVLFSNSTFPGLTSRCTIPAVCRTASAWAVPMPMPLTSSAGSGWPSSPCARGCPSTYSQTR